MRYANKTNFIIPLGRCKLTPYGISRDFSQKEIDANDAIAFYKSKGNIIDWKDGDPLPIPQPKSNKVDKRYEVEPDFEDGKLVTKDIGSGKRVEYVVASADEADMVHMNDESLITSKGRDLGHIETGVDASKFKNGAQAIEDELNRESREAEYTDEDTLAEGESDRGDALDLDKAEEVDMSETVRKDGKFGARVTNAKTLIQTTLTSELNKISQEVSKGLENGEAVPADAAPGQVVEFLKQSFDAKKFMISRENDTEFLGGVKSATQSEVIKKLVTQRMSELE